jgi:hypothetical protein
MTWDFVDNPNFTTTGVWTTNALDSTPDFFAFAPGSFARMSLQVTATGVRPGYEGPIGRMNVGVVTPASGRSAYFVGSSEIVYPDIWYTFGIHQTTADYIWGDQTRWPKIGAAFWSNARAGGGQWELRCWTF